MSEFFHNKHFWWNFKRNNCRPTGEMFIVMSNIQSTAVGLINELSKKNVEIVIKMLGMSVSDSKNFILRLLGIFEISENCQNIKAQILINLI